MRMWLILALTLVVIVSGCTGTTSPESSQGTQNASSGGTSGTTGDGGKAKTSQNVGNVKTEKKELPPSVITKEQADKISLNSKYEDMVKLTGSIGKQIKDENGKKTYEFVLSNLHGYYVALVYSEDGKLIEKRLYQK